MTRCMKVHPLPYNLNYIFCSYTWTNSHYPWGVRTVDNNFRNLEPQNNPNKTPLFCNIKLKINTFVDIFMHVLYNLYSVLYLV